MPVIAGDTRFQPVYVGDVADAVLAAAEREDAPGRTYELAGPRSVTFRELLRYVGEVTGHRRPLVDMPMGLARLQARFGEFLPNPPLTRDQLLMLGRDNVAGPGRVGLGGAGHPAEGDGSRRAELPDPLPPGRRTAAVAAPERSASDLLDDYCGCLCRSMFSSAGNKDSDAVLSRDKRSPSL